MESALTGVTVMDLTHFVAGPYCTKLFADYGATVIKIENPSGGDGARKMGPFAGDDVHPEKSGLFLHLNTNKKGITLNLKSRTGKRIFKELVETADILVENFEPRVMPDLGLDYPVLADINPRLVKTSISNFGQTGPYRDYKASELVLFAMGPHMFSEGEPDREPLMFPGYKSQYLAGTYGAAVGTSLGGMAGLASLRGYPDDDILIRTPTPVWSDNVAAGTAAFAALTALHFRKRTGKGQFIDLAQVETFLPHMGEAILEYTMNQRVPEPKGNLDSSMAPHGCYPCSGEDNWVVISVSSDEQWEAFCREFPDELHKTFKRRNKWLSG